MMMIQALFVPLLVSWECQGWKRGEADKFDLLTN